MPTRPVARSVLIRTKPDASDLMRSTTSFAVAVMLLADAG